MTTTQGAFPDLLKRNAVQVLIVDNDCDSGSLYTALFEIYGMEAIEVKTAASIQEALDLLNQSVPDILICEARFLGESVYPLIQNVKQAAQKSCKNIPIFVISTFPVMNLVKEIEVQVDAYQIKPIEIDQFMDRIWTLLLPTTLQPLEIQNCQN